MTEYFLLKSLDSITSIDLVPYSSNLKATRRYLRCKQSPEDQFLPLPLYLMTEQIQAKSLINKDRLDLVVKYLYAKEFLESEGNDYSTDVYKDLYTRHILMRTMGKEPRDAYRNESSDKRCVEDYIRSFQNLILSIQQNGFDENYPVPVRNNLLENGAHRIAASAVLHKDIPIVRILGGGGYSWDFDWFCKNGFNTEDKQRILKGFVDIHPDQCAVFVVWNPLFKYIDQVTSVIKRYFDVVGEVELDFEDNYIAFTNALLEIYEPNIARSGNDETIRAKAKLLQASYLSFRVIVVTNQNKNSNQSTSELSKTCKGEIRDLFAHILPKGIFCTVHSSNGKEECSYLASLLLSPNNIKHLHMRLSTRANDNFIQRIRKLPSFLPTIDIDSTNDVCVMRSGAMAAMGILEDVDVGFITDEKYRDKLGWGPVSLHDGYDIDVSEKEANRPKNIPDNILIHNSEYHFLFKGVKFANLQIVKDRKSLRLKPKDDDHFRQIDLFEKLIGHINQQKILKERIEAEQRRRANISRQSSPLTVPQRPPHDSFPIPHPSTFSFIERIFSVKNDRTDGCKRKVVTIFGQKFKFPTKKQAKTKLGN